MPMEIRPTELINLLPSKGLEPYSLILTGLDSEKQICCCKWLYGGTHCQQPYLIVSDGRSRGGWKGVGDQGLNGQGFCGLRTDIGRNGSADTTFRYCLYLDLCQLQSWSTSK